MSPLRGIIMAHCSRVSLSDFSFLSTSVFYDSHHASQGHIADCMHLSSLLDKDSVVCIFSFLFFFILFSIASAGANVNFSHISTVNVAGSHSECQQSNTTTRHPEARLPLAYSAR